MTTETKLDIALFVSVWVAVFAAFMGMDFNWIQAFTFANVVTSIVIMIRTPRIR